MRSMCRELVLDGDLKSALSAEAVHEALQWALGEDTDFGIMVQAIDRDEAAREKAAIN